MNYLNYHQNSIDKQLILEKYFKILSYHVFRSFFYINLSNTSVRFFCEGKKNLTDVFKKII